LGEYNDEEETNVQPTVSPSQEITTEIVLPTCYEFDTSMKQKLILLIVDDSHGYDQPLQKIVIKDFHLIDTVWTGGEITAAMLVTISASVYNMKVADWEPMLEQYGLQFDYERKAIKSKHTLCID
jgi:hypothetical protein